MQFVLRGQPVTRLDLERGHAAGQDPTRRRRRGARSARRRRRDAWPPRWPRCRRRPQRSRPGWRRPTAWRTPRGGCRRTGGGSGTRSARAATDFPVASSVWTSLSPQSRITSAVSPTATICRRGSRPLRRRSSRARPVPTPRRGSPRSRTRASWAAWMTLRSLTTPSSSAPGQSRAPSHVVSMPRVATDKVHRAVEVVVVVDGQQVREGRRLSEQLERQSMPGVVGVEQVAGKGEQPAALLGADLADGQVLVQPRSGLGVGEAGGARRDAQLAAAQVASQVHHRRQLGAGQHPARDRAAPGWASAARPGSSRASSIAAVRWAWMPSR